MDKAEYDLSCRIDNLVQKIADKYDTPLFVSKRALSYALITSYRSLMNNTKKYFDDNPHLLQK